MNSVELVEWSEYSMQEQWQTHTYEILVIKLVKINSRFSVVDWIVYEKYWSERIMTTKEFNKNVLYKIN